MAKKVLTGGAIPDPGPDDHSDLECSHSGKIQTTPSAKLTVKGNKVLTNSDVSSGSSFLGCTNTVVASSEVPCSAVTSVTSSPASKLKVGGVGVTLDDVAGKTNSTPTPGDLQLIDAEQTKLTAI